MKMPMYADFQVFREKMLAMAEEKGQCEICYRRRRTHTAWIWLTLGKNDSSLALACFDRVIEDFYPFSGQAFYYKALVILKYGETAF